jgi:hypothetical protein
MQIGPLEVAFLILLFLGIILVSRMVTHLQTKRVCPDCGLAMRTYLSSCPSCGCALRLKRKGKSG